MLTDSLKALMSLIILMSGLDIIYRLLFTVSELDQTDFLIATAFVVVGCLCLAYDVRNVVCWLCDKRG